ncbi:MAG TPA: hypothetical protein ENN33_06840 [Ignavibacteria bacterium]|nr:hypothetical protein [Ignavibacteria bacterium]
MRFVYAFLPKSYKLEYYGEFIKVFGSTDILLNIKNTELSFTNYFGFGNENAFDRYLYRDKYYWLEQKVLFTHLTQRCYYLKGCCFQTFQVT